MRTRRSFLGSMAATMTLPLCLPAGRAWSQARPRLHAMIVGIDVYTGRAGSKDRVTGRIVHRTISQLRGCINDSRAIEAAVRPLAATTRVLLNTDVNRASFMRTWNAMVLEAAPGDTLLLTYAGHGGQERERVPGSEDDGLDETLILSPFDSSIPSLNEERIIDDEIEGLLRSVAGRNRVIFVADACHSGTMTRGGDLRVEGTIRYRTVHQYDIEGELKGEVKMPSAPDGDELPHVLYLSASQDNELVPEIMINGRHQGALSLAFAQALAGRADTNRDGIVTGAELSNYVLRSIRALSDATQHPEVRWPHADVSAGSLMRLQDPMFYLGPATPEAPRERPGGTLRLQILGISDIERRSIGGALKNAKLVEESEPADLTWDAASREVLDQLGNITAYGVHLADLQVVVDGIRAIDAVRRMTGTSGMGMRLLLPGESLDSSPSRASDRTHRKGTRLTLVATELQYPHFVLFNITGNGTVQFLYPNHARGDAPAVDPGKPYKLPLVVSGPFGADHAIAVASANAMPDLIATLQRLHGQKKPMDAVEALSDLARGRIRVGMQGIFTTGR